MTVREDRSPLRRAQKTLSPVALLLVSGLMTVGLMAVGLMAVGCGPGPADEARTGMLMDEDPPAAQETALSSDKEQKQPEEPFPVADPEASTPSRMEMDLQPPAAQLQMQEKAGGEKAVPQPEEPRPEKGK